MKISLLLALAASLSLASCSSDPIPDLTRSSAPEDSVRPPSLSFDLEDSDMEEDVDTVVFNADPGF